MINSRDINDLLPAVAKKCFNFVTRCEAEGIDVLITSTYRDHEKQAALYAVGRTTKGEGATPAKPMGRIVTNAKAGESFHNYRLAFDFVPVTGKIARWNDTETFTRCGEIAESLGLQWAGRWKGKLKEAAHCQDSGGLTIAQLKAGIKPEYLV